VTEFVYDGVGRRVAEWDNGSLAKQWVWCGTELCEERNASNTVTKRFFPQGEQISGTAYFYSRDHLGSVREMTDASGTVHARYNYDPFGARSANTITTSAVESDFGFTGDYYNPTIGLDLTLYRAYNPSLGRWLNRDPIGEKGGMNLYGYVGNNPIVNIDPLGLYNLGDFGEDSLGFAAGLGDAVSLGATDWLAKQIDGEIMGPDAKAAIQSVQDCSGAFKAGEWASLLVGAGRLAYGGLAKGASLAYAAAGTGDYAGAVATRNALKSAFRLGMGGEYKMYTADQMLEKYGSAKAVIVAAGRTNLGYNAAGALAAFGGAKGLMSGGCPTR
jgi:RHS repeat-associated protein